MSQLQDAMGLKPQQLPSSPASLASPPLHSIPASLWIQGTVIQAIKLDHLTEGWPLAM